MKKSKAYSYSRFSTPEQMKGDSFRRQIDLSQRYADENDLDLDDTLTFQDLGVSAFRGANIEAGALGAFIKAVEDGHVKSGSYLLVESLDRLSRQTVWQALQQFQGILNNGVNVVTIQDGKVYSASNGEMDFTDIMLSLVSMQRAHEESLTKSKRLSEVWKAKREKARNGELKLTAKCPAWLRLNQGNNSFDVIEERAKIVQRIFQMTIDGIGKGSIVRIFNKEGVPTFGRSKGWYSSYIQKILENEAVVGVFQPHKKKTVDGKRIRVPEGVPIQDYFPQVVGLETFLRAKRMRTERRIPIGKTGVNFSNIFTGLAFCGDCGATMHFENKGQRPKGGTYLVCSNARRKVGDCVRHAWKYPLTQYHIIANIYEIDFRELLPDLHKRTQQAVDRLEGAILVKEEQLNKNRQALDNVTENLMERPKSPTLLDKLDELEDQQNEIETELERLRSEFDRERERIDNASSEYDDMFSLLIKYIEIEHEGNPKKIYDARNRLYQLFKNVIDRITFFPLRHDDHLFGNIEITFKDVDKYCRLISVEKNQLKSNTQVDPIDARWPPEFHPDKLLKKIYEDFGVPDGQEH